MKKLICILITLMITLLFLPAVSEENGYPEKVFDEPKSEWTVSEKEGLVIPIDLHGMPLKNIEHKASNDNFFYYYLDAAGLHIFPIAKGKATITLANKLNKRDKTVVTIIIEESAVYAKGEESPLRAIIVADNSVVDKNEITGKLIILGGSNKYTYVKVTQCRMFMAGTMYDEDLERAPKIRQNKATFKVSVNSSVKVAYRFHVYVEDSNGGKTDAYSQPVLVEANDLDALSDTKYFAYPLDKGSISFKYYVKGGKKPYKAELVYWDEREGNVHQKYKVVEEKNDFNFKYPEHISSSSGITLTISDKNGNNAYIVVPDRFGTKLLALKCNKPFANTGDEVFIGIIGDDSEFDISFIYYDMDLDAFECKETPVRGVKKSKDGYTIPCPREGEIYVTGVINSLMVRERMIVVSSDGQN